MTICSVVVPTYRRPELLGRCLAALDRQTIDAASIEIIVADDAASEETREQVARWQRASTVSLRYLAVAGRHGPAAARNAGWHAASGEIIAFTDDDTEPDSHWIARGVDGMRRAKLDAAWGRVVVPLPPRPTDYERDAAGLERAGFVTANCFVRRAALEAVGGFDDSFAMAWREDSDLFFRLLRADCRIDKIDDAVVVHPLRPASWGVSLRQQRKAAYDALLYKKDRTLYARFVRPGRPSLYYAIVVALAVMISAGLTHHTSAALLAGVAWLILTATFAARRLRGTSRAPTHVAEMLVTSAIIPPLSLFWRAVGGVRHRVAFW
jgi:glycosyltransferase involved in cell wall biosynthesis